MNWFKPFKSRSAAPPPARPAAVAPARPEGDPAGVAATTLQPPRRRLLWVDDNANRRQTTRETFQRLRPDWEMVYAANGGEAIDWLDRAPFDAVLSEMRMEQFTGVEMLNKVIRRCPRTLRAVRCLPEEVALTKSCLGTPPIILPRETDVAAFEDLLGRAFQLETWMMDPALRKLYDQLTQLPTLPTLYNQVIAELQSPTGSLEFIARIISKDPMMTAKMLQMANSAELALPRQITETVEAVLLLGAERVKSLILLSQVFTQFDNTKCPGFLLHQMWMHCMAIGAQSMAIAREETRDPRVAEMAFTAGLLHDVGMLLLAGNLPIPYGRILKRAAQERRSVGAVELEEFGASHAEVGACLLGAWGLPLPILEAIAWHHCPAKTSPRGFSLLAAVHVANALDSEKKAPPGEPPVVLLDLPYLVECGLADRLPRWRELCGSPARLAPKDG